MRFFFYIAICLGLVVCQTTLIPRLPAMGNFFDLLLPLVVYLAAFRPVHEALQRLLHRRDIGKGLHPCGARPQLARGLRTAEHQFAEQAHFGRV